MLFVRCFCPCDVGSALIYLDVCSDLIRGDVCSTLSPTMRSEILCSLSSSIAVADGRFLVVCHSLSSLDFVTDGLNSIVATTA